MSSHPPCVESRTGSAVDARSRALFDRCDLAAYVNVRQLRKDYRNTLDMAKSQVEAFIGQMGAALATRPQPGIDMQSILNHGGP